MRRWTSELLQVPRREADDRTVRSSRSGVFVAIVLTMAACGDITTVSPTRSCSAEVERSSVGGEVERAATFAIRAGGSAGFLDEGPTFRDYVGTKQTEDGFQAHFAPDLDVDVVLSDGSWHVQKVDGVIDEETCFTLLGYDEIDSQEPAEHAFLNVRLRAENKRAAIRAALIGSPVWLGPIPYEGFKSRCYAELYDEAGEPTHRTRFYPIDIPAEETNRTSGNTFIEVPGDKNAASGRFHCETIASTKG